MKPAQPKTEEVTQDTPPVSATPADKISALPAWLQHELTTQVELGGRNNHCIKLAPALLREGLSAEEVFAALSTLYPGEAFRLPGLIKRAEVYAKTERDSSPEWAAEHARLQGKTERARLLLPRIIADYELPDFETTLPDLSLPHQRQLFLSSMFQPEDTIWIGDKMHSGENFKHHFRTLRAWMDHQTPTGEFVSHCTFKPGSVHRNTESMFADKYLVLESDTLEPFELGAVARYMFEFHGLPLQAIVTTGGKRHAPAPGLHFWFLHPGTSTLPDWKAVLAGYGADVATLRGPQPVRLPGIIRRDTGLPQELLWLNQGTPWPI